MKPSFRNFGRGLVIAGATAALVMSGAGVSSAATTPTDTHRVTVRTVAGVGPQLNAGLNGATTYNGAVVQGVYVSVNAPLGTKSVPVEVKLNGVTEWRQSLIPGQGENLGVVVTSGKRFTVTVTGAGRTLTMYGFVVAGSGASKGALLSFGTGQYYYDNNTSTPVIYVNGTGVGVSNYGYATVAPKLGNTVFASVTVGGLTCNQVLAPRVGSGWCYLPYGNGNITGTLAVKSGKTLRVTNRFAGWLPKPPANNN